MEEKQYLSYQGLQDVAGHVNTRLKTVTTIPASADDGAVRLYVGETGVTYKKGHIYQYNATDLEWVDITGSSASSDNIVEGYFNSTDNLFYEESTYITPIIGTNNVIYISLDTDLLYRYNGSIFIRVDEVDISDKADKVTSATNGDLAGLDANGNLTDSGVLASDILVKSSTAGLVKNDGTIDTNSYATTTQLADKTDKVANATNGNLAGLDSNGNLTDSGVVADNVIEKVATATGLLRDDGTVDTSTYATTTQLAGKADKVANATADDFATLDANGNLTDSGINKNIIPNTATSSNKLATNNDLPTELNDLSDDVTITSPTNGQILKYNATSGKWENQTEQPPISGATFKGSILFANIPTTGMENGDWYDIKDAFTTDSRFEEGAGIECTAGTDIIWVTDDSKWNILTPSGVNSFNGRVGAVVPASGDYDASDIDYDNTTSGLTATDVQDAIDEVNTNVNGKANKVSGAMNGHLAGLDANGNLTDSGVVANNVIEKVSTATGLLRDNGTVNTTIEGAVAANTNAISAIKDGQSIDSFGDVETALAGKQDVLTFDHIPKDNSLNPVRSDGIYDSFIGAYDYMDEVIGWNGKNILPVNDGTVSKYGITAASSNGVITLNGTAEQAMLINLATFNSDDLKAYGEKLFMTGAYSDKAFLTFYKDDWTYTKDDKGNGVEIDPSELDANTEYKVIMQIANGTVLTNAKMYPMIRLLNNIDPSFAPHHANVKESLDEKFSRSEQAVLGAKNVGEIILGYYVQEATTGQFKLTADANAITYIAKVEQNTDYRCKKNAYGDRFAVTGFVNYPSKTTTTTEASRLFDDSSATEHVVNTGIYNYLAFTANRTTEVAESSVKGMIYLASDPDPTYVPYAMTNRELTNAVKNIPTVSVSHTGTASSTGVRKQIISVDSVSYEVDGSAYMEQEVILSTSNATTVTFTNAIITDGKTLTLETSIWDLVPDDMVTTEGVCTITLPKWSSAVTIGVRLRVR